MTHYLCLKAMESNINDNEMLVRYLYGLGNCLAADHRARQVNTRLPRSIRRILSHYYKKGNHHAESNNRKSKEVSTSHFRLSKENSDVILKVIRLIANFSLDESGAAAVLEEKLILTLLLKLLRVSVRNGESY